MKRNKKNWLLFGVVIFIITGISVYYIYFFSPKNSLELYQDIAFADTYEKALDLTEEGYEAYFQEEDFEHIKEGSLEQIGQFTLLDYDDQSYIVMTTPGTEKLKVLRVESLPEDIRVYLKELLP
ncbi:hypothetical protein [Ornithinibacillus xuwenensis]|uniref:DUF3139 domain-containing protein n=1 Tax=Ornithinibacillus xuwenensis TaxID=3144668 RepID=A0ABU9XD81_9BACI